MYLVLMYPCASVTHFNEASNHRPPGYEPGTLTSLPFARLVKQTTTAQLTMTGFEPAKRIARGLKPLPFDQTWVHCHIRAPIS
jgi:hypothetical protein